MTQVLWFFIMWTSVGTPPAIYQFESMAHCTMVRQAMLERVPEAAVTPCTEATNIVELETHE